MYFIRTHFGDTDVRRALIALLLQSSSLSRGHRFIIVSLTDGIDRSRVLFTFYNVPTYSHIDNCCQKTAVNIICIRLSGWDYLVFLNAFLNQLWLKSLVSRAVGEWHTTTIDLERCVPKSLDLLLPFTTNIL